jgi:hypothetical protein
VDDGEALAVGQVQDGAVHEGAADDVLVRARRDRIEAQRREHQPGRHLADVVIAGEAVGAGVVLAVDDLLEPGLGPPRGAGVDVHVAEWWLGSLPWMYWPIRPAMSSAWE